MEKNRIRTMEIHKIKKKELHNISLNKKVYNENNGITLIALVITIIVLLILARSYNKLCTK